MKPLFYKSSIQVAVLTFLLFFNLNSSAQTENNSKLTDINKNDVVMNWNKSTPEQEMKDDCKALLEKGITIKYSNVKRNSKQEITGLKVEYSDRKGNKGTMELNNQSPISPITFFKEGEQIGFGNPKKGMMIAGIVLGIAGTTMSFYRVYQVKQALSAFEQLGKEFSNEMKVALDSAKNEIIDAVADSLKSH